MTETFERWYLTRSWRETIETVEAIKSSNRCVWVRPVGEGGDFVRRMINSDDAIYHRSWGAAREWMIKRANIRRDGAERALKRALKEIEIASMIPEEEPT